MQPDKRHTTQMHDIIHCDSSTLGCKFFLLRWSSVYMFIYCGTRSFVLKSCGRMSGVTVCVWVCCCGLWSSSAAFLLCPETDREKEEEEERKEEEEEEVEEEEEEILVVRHRVGCWNQVSSPRTHTPNQAPREKSKIRSEARDWGATKSRSVFYSLFFENKKTRVSSFWILGPQVSQLEGNAASPTADISCFLMRIYKMADDS